MGAVQAEVQVEQESAGPVAGRREDVVIVGAGVIGLACALILIEDGRRVRVIDAGRIGGGSSHGNCGTITPSHATPLAAPGVIAQALKWILTPDAPLYLQPRLDPQLWGWLLRFAARCNERDWRASAVAKAALLNDSRERLQEWVARYGLVCEFDSSGVDYVFRSEDGYAHGQHELDLLREFGVGVELIDGGAYEAQDPAFKPGLVGAIRFAHDAVLRPDRYVAELARAVRERGGELQEYCALKDLREDADGVVLDTSHGLVHAREAVVALGAWSPKLADAIGLPALKGAIQPGKGYSITYDRPELLPRRPVVLKEPKVCVTMWDSGYRLGSTMEFSGFDESLNPRRLAALERGAAQFLHQPLGPVERERWYGWRPMSFDDVPLIGRVPGRQRLWIANGHGMMGVSMSAGTGQLLADLIGGRAPAIDPHPYRPERFA
ncbi:NAD(P)/FAD-dependent oxidoreductase [Lysobacter enzymogenes]|uniref:NAD(P)/FAD-dependent oxidoreductase n=1 Tax=Lysobacter enzymogenes TaxID=69 RepID=UPI0008941C13|nr:FAD-dependent oxidoreductase [Lysobacter enzymogenes]SDW55234.1 D-amino-acid dehydrogenase [Lysobacter enzymogenes]